MTEKTMIDFSVEEMLNELLKNFYISHNKTKAEQLYYSWREDVCVGDQNAMLEKALIKYIYENKIQPY